MSIPTHQIGQHTVGVVGYGIMALTWVPTVIEDAVAFKAIKTAIELGANNINSGEFYSQTLGTQNLELLSRFFVAEPELAKKVFLSVKGGLVGLQSNSSPANLRKSVENINAALKVRKMDLFECARQDPNYPIEDTIRVLKGLIEEGHFKYIGLSEASASTIRRAHAIHPITAVEMEYSFFSLEIETNGVLATCKELGIPLIAYSPLGRGFLGGKLRSRADLPEGDNRLHFDRFSEENFPKNLAVADRLAEVAAKKGISLATLAVAWVVAMGAFPIPGSSRVEGVKESVLAANVKFTEEELKEIRGIIDSAVVVGLRYNKHAEHTLTL